MSVLHHFLHKVKNEASVWDVFKKIEIRYQASHKASPLMVASLPLAAVRPTQPSRIIYIQYPRKKTKPTK